MIDEATLGILACPICKKSIIANSDDKLLCPSCNREYEVLNDIPIMGIEKNENDYSAVQYHLEELKIAQNPSDPRHLMPQFKKNHRTILDIGCGIGQTYVASNLHEDDDKLVLGIDVSLESLSYGRQHYHNIGFVNGYAENLPLKSQSIDFVISRVTLPLTDIPQAMKEIRRVLKPGGEIWIALHPLNTAMKRLMKSVRTFNHKDFVLRSYVLLNGFVFHLFGKLFPLPFNGTLESFQTTKAMVKLLTQNEFENIKIERKGFFLITAAKM